MQRRHALTLTALALLAGPALAQDKVSFATNWKAQAAHGGFYQALASGLKLEDVSAVTGFDPWFLSQLVLIENQKLKIQKLAGALEDASLASILEENLRTAKQLGFADSFLARLLSTPAARLFSLDIRNMRKKLGI